MFRTIRFLFLTQFIAVSAHAWSIEEVSGPRVDGLVNTVNRYSVHHEGTDVLYGRCEETEARCLPNSPSYSPRRKVTYDEYQEHLARTFDVDPRYLKNHEKQQKNFTSIVTTLQQILDASSTSAEEKDKALEKFNALTQKGGIVDRFTRAIAIKQSLEWDPADPEKHQVIFERSQHQFRQSLQPMDFATDFKIEDPTVAFEPSTERSWHFAGNQFTRKEADAACARKGLGYHVPSIHEVKNSPWLYSSYLGDALDTLKSYAGKVIWVSDVESERRQTGQHEGTTSPYGGRVVTILDYTRFARFKVLVLTGNPKYPHEVKSVDISTGNDGPNHTGAYVDIYGDGTAKYSALCVKETGEAF